MSPSTPTLYLAIDQGGQSSRVAIYDEAGQQLACFSAPSKTQSYIDAQGGMCVEQDGVEILAGVRSGINQVIDFLGSDVNRVKGAGFAGQGSSLICWSHKTGEALSPVLSWQDRRAETILNKLDLAQDNVRALTGLRVSPHYGASKIRWCLDNFDNVKIAEKSGDLRIGPIASYLFRNLLQVDGVVVCRIDPGHAQRTLLWNLTHNDWDEFLLSCFKLSTSILPECAWHDSYFGDLELGAHRVPMISSQRDQGASLFARGLPERDACYVNIGTGAFIQRICDQRQTPDGLLVSPLWLPNPDKTKPSIKNLYAWEATVNGAAAALDWLADETALSEVTPELIEKALMLKPSRECYLLNAVGGLSAPYWRTDVRSVFSENLTAHEKILAWIESVIFQIVINIQLMQAAGEIQKIYISGGLSRAAGVCQRLADLSGVTVLRSENSDATLQGIAYTVAGFPDKWSESAHDECFYSQPNHALRQSFAIWQQAMTNWLTTGNKC